MIQGNIENLVILLLVKGRTYQVKLTTPQKHLFAELILGALTDSGQLKVMPVDDKVRLQPDAEAFLD